jgi:hypothetical protein
VVESWFGNTSAVASAVAEGLRRSMTVEVRDVGAPLALDRPIDLLVVGGPTHALGMSRPDTRKDAARQAGRTPATDIGVREWLGTLPRGVLGKVAAFDTKIDKSWVPGSAARGIGKRLRALGGDLVTAPESFRVTGTPGPLAAGELDRARQWGERLAATLGVAGMSGR